MSDDRRTLAVYASLESAREAVERTVNESNSREHWRALVKGVLIYWLGELYEEGAGYTKDLETSIAVLRKQVESLKRDHAALKVQYEILRGTKGR